ncbi:aldehyde dehydrogenase family protein [Congregibacter litoralis]|uniref:NAD-dependent aldehyde dehydrogenase n=1 Tax=Congregibacter litoralis KT71 TaxID=314285 RepID=A4ABA3_9GAMM|nr:aldehyde dehydrogenase family protein [Congregibacter litoralis]EAQ96657.1 NAD-dependent aldehyde dehydrogenase [Congregibacter litoralis KT71]
MSDYKLLINGALVDGDDSFDVINPATEQTVAVSPRASIAQADAAIAAAKAAFPGWSQTPFAERSALLNQLADTMMANAEELARVLTQEQGKPLAEAMQEIGFTEAFIRHLASIELQPEVLFDTDDRWVEKRHSPLGVVVAIAPWNFPLLIFTFKLAAALITGNTVVGKPSPTTPLTALKMAEFCKAIFPAGVVNVVTDLNDLGPHLTSHPDVAKVSFTGSTATGKKVMASAADSLKRITLELGGNDAAIVLDDADIDALIEPLFNYAFMNCGQVCLAIKRIYVPERLYEKLVAGLSALAAAVKVGNGLEEGVQIGPLQNAMQYQKVREYLADARQHGEVVAGGEVPEGPGFFITPAIVSGLADGHRLVDEEQFGPLLPVVRYSDLDQVIEAINAGPNGLAGSIWSADLERAKALAYRIHTGTLWINHHLDFGPHIPFAGAKQSGIGVEFSEEGLKEFTQLQVVNLAR